MFEKWKTMEHESDGDTNCNWRARYSQQRIGTGSGGLENKRTSGDYPSYSIESWRLQENCCHLDSCEKLLANAGVKNSQKSKIIIPYNREQTNYHFHWMQFFFKPFLTGEFLAKSEWQRVPLGLQYSFKPSCWFQQCCTVNDLNFYTDL